MPNPDYTISPYGRATRPAPAAASQKWLLTAVGESMTHTGPFHEAAELAERSWIAANGTDEGALVWSREPDGSWSLLHQQDDGGLMPTQIKVRAFAAKDSAAPPADAPLAVMLDEVHRIAVARLMPGQILTVTAPPCTADVTGKPGYGWTLISFDDFGVRPRFTHGREFLAATHAGTGDLYRAIEDSTLAIEAGEAQVARVVFEPRGTKRKPIWHATGHELINQNVEA
jgi:hypothetical protein